MPDPANPNERQLVGATSKQITYVDPTARVAVFVLMDVFGRDEMRKARKLMTKLASRTGVEPVSPP